MSTPQHGQDGYPHSTPQSHLRSIGFVGLGQLGYPIARNLATPIESGSPGSPHLLVWNRTKAKSEALLHEIGEDRIRIAKNVEQIAIECDVIITNLANDTVAKDIFEKFVKALHVSPPSNRKIFVETSTLYPTFAGELDRLVSSVPKAHLVTCPVFGTPPVAANRQLLLVMSGDYLSKKELAHLFVPAIGRKIFDLGGSVERAPTFKLIGNSMILGMIEALAESFTLAAKAGISSETVLQLVKDLIPAPGIVLHSSRIAHDDFGEPLNFAIDGGIKDLGHIRRLTTEHGSPMPGIDIAHQHMLTARAIHQAQKAEGRSEYDTIDATAIVAGSRVAAGLDPFDGRKHATVVNVEKED